jgi:hypothetical protein
MPVPPSFRAPPVVAALVQPGPCEGQLRRRSARLLSGRP